MNLNGTTQIGFQIPIQVFIGIDQFTQIFKNLDYGILHLIIELTLQDTFVKNNVSHFK